MFPYESSIVWHIRLIHAKSLVYRIKAERAEFVSHSLQTGVWSNRHGANSAIQNAWANKDTDAKLMFLFSMKLPGNRNAGQFCALAEMVGFQLQELE